MIATRALRQLVLAMTVLITTTACSYRSHYDGMMASKRFECQELPKSQYEECMASTQKPYEQYKRERQEAKDIY